MTDAFTPDPVRRGLSFSTFTTDRHDYIHIAWLREDGDCVFFDESYLGDYIGNFKTRDLVKAIEAVLAKEDPESVQIDPVEGLEGPPTLHVHGGDRDLIVYTHSCGDRRFIHRETVQQLLDHLRSWLSTPSSS